MIGTDPLVTSEYDAGVALIRLSHPARRNAWSIELETGYFDLLDRAELDPAVRVIVLTGSGRHFCPGLDVNRLEAKSRGVPAPVRTRPISYPLGVRKPLIAAINGTTAGVGLVQAVLCDLRFAAAGARFATSFTRRGLASEHLLSWLLPRLVGHGNASDLLLSGRVFVAEEAHRMGLVNRVVKADRLLEETIDYARDLAANCSPLSMAQVKEQLLGDWLRSPADSLLVSERLTRDERRRAELAEGVSSLLDKRPPQFATLPTRAEGTSHAGT